MSSYLKISNGSETKAYMLSSDDNNIEKPYLRVSGSVLPLTTRTTNGLGLKIQDSASEGSTHYITTKVNTTVTYTTTDTVSNYISDTSAVSITETWYSQEATATGSTSRVYSTTKYYYTTDSSIEYTYFAGITSKSNSTFYGFPLTCTFKTYSTRTNRGPNRTTEYGINNSTTTCVSTTVLWSQSHTYAYYSFTATSAAGKTYTSIRTIYGGKSSYSTETEVSTFGTLIYRPLEYIGNTTNSTITLYSAVTYSTTNNAMSSTASFTSNVSMYSQKETTHIHAYTNFKTYSDRHTSKTLSIGNVTSTTTSMNTSGIVKYILYGDYMYYSSSVSYSTKTSTQGGISRSTTSTNYYTGYVRRSEVYYNLSYTARDTTYSYSYSSETRYRDSYTTISNGSFYTKDMTLYSGISSLTTQTTIGPWV